MIVRRIRIALVAFMAIAAVLLPMTQAIASDSFTISGVAFADTDRDGQPDAGEQPYVDHQIALYDASGTWLAQSRTDASGRYQFAGLSAGTYKVEYGMSGWFSMRSQLVPTTTGSLYPNKTVQLTASTTVDFGWRPIVRSTDPAAPIDVFVGANGLRVESFDDAVSARSIHDAVYAGAMVGEEASKVTIKFDITPSSTASSSVQQSNGQYTNYSSLVYVDWASWLDHADQTLFHEYGHAWSLYYAHIYQQDASLSGYVAARGLTGDSRLNSSYVWSVRELIAEDYRILFGTAAAAQQAQMNPDVAHPSSVPGLRDYLAGSFRQASSTSPSPAPAPAPAPSSVDVSAVSMNPAPVSASGTASYTVSTGSTATVKILDSKGGTVRTLVASQTVPAGTHQAIWNRTNNSGRRVKAGNYKLVVEARDSAGSVDTAQFTFKVS